MYRTACRLPYVRERIAIVVSDRECGATQFAAQIGHETQIVPHRGGELFSDAVLDLLVASQIDLAISFYTRLFRGRLLDAYEGRLVNFHPSILPAAAGTDGFGDTIRSGSRFIGSTVHLVDAGIDTGLPVLQAAVPNDPSVSLVRRRHIVFLQQCKSLVQIVRWYEEGRVRSDGGQVLVDGARYEPSEFSPNLDFAEALEFSA
ncbi:phosphoribosylglycinamide formyltransferase [Kaistia algarum]|uniref:phosphoribosylglycinamide formyltransferase n=1 Tax=Kaistia algarum TaxID=2083279 RepID=UPI0038995A81